MSTTLSDLEKAINSGLTTAVKKSEINFEQLFHITPDPCSFAISKDFLEI